MITAWITGAPSLAKPLSADAEQKSVECLIRVAWEGHGHSVVHVIYVARVLPGR